MIHKRLQPEYAASITDEVKQSGNNRVTNFGQKKLDIMWGKTGMVSMVKETGLLGT
jgi:hypothetical protein